MFPYVIPPMVIIHIRPPGCCCFCVLNSVYITYHYFQVKLQPDLFILWLVSAAAFHITSSGSLSVRKNRRETHSLILYLLFAFSFPSSLWVGIFFTFFFFFSIPIQIVIKTKNLPNDTITLSLQFFSLLQYL